MSRYIHHIIKYFFSHQVTDETVTKVHRRLALSDEDTEDTFREIWDGLDHDAASEESIERAWQRTTHTIWGSNSRMPKLYAWLRLAALWVIPVVLIGSTYFIYKSMSYEPNYYKEVRFIHKFTAYGERELVTLPDSSKVWLNSGSTLIYPSRFVSKERNVCLTGEAFFDVTKDKEHPFIVDVNQIRLKVLGTSFNVCSYPDNPEITTTLESGKIQVDIEGKDQTYLLSPHDHLVYNSQTGQVDISHLDIDNYSVWRTGALYFNDAKFRQVITQLERAYNVKIHIRNDQFDDQTIRVHFNSNESIEEVMSIIKMLIPALHYEIKGQDVYIE